jgi:ricin-type beta-trefoil lectin protein
MRNVTRLLLALITLGAALPLLARPAAADNVFGIKNWGNGFCLGIAGSSKASGARAVQGGCSGSPTQSWTVARITFDTDGTQYVQYQNGVGMCLGVHGSSTVSGAQVVQGTCATTITDETRSQYWRAQDVSMPIPLINFRSQLCMGIQNSSSAAGANVVIGTCGGSSGPGFTPTQRWILDTAL